MVFYYNYEKLPQRPECRLDIGNPRERNKIAKKVDAVADTGADMTMIPDSLIGSLGNLIEGEIRCGGVNGIAIRKTYLVDITVDNYPFNSIEVVAIPKNHALIGRDILNQHKASFDASENCWRLECGGNCTLTSSQ